MSRKYRNGKLNLWSNALDPSLSREQLIFTVPDGIHRDQWSIFVDYHLKPEYQDEGSGHGMPTPRGRSSLARADIRSVCTEAGVYAIHSQRKTLTEKDFLDAVNKVIKGYQKFSATPKYMSSPLRRATIQILKTIGSSISWTTTCQKTKKIPLTTSLSSSKFRVKPNTCAKSKKMIPRSTSPSSTFKAPSKAPPSKVPPLIPLRTCSVKSRKPPSIWRKSNNSRDSPLFPLTLIPLLSLLPIAIITESNVKTGDVPGKLDDDKNRESISKPIICGAVKSGPHVASLGIVFDIVKKGYHNFVLSCSTQVHATEDSPVNGGGLSQNGKFSYGYASFPGKISSMEDFYETGIDGVDGEIVSFFGVFDGHDGARAAKYVKLFLSLGMWPFMKRLHQSKPNPLHQTKLNPLHQIRLNPLARLHQTRPNPLANQYLIRHLPCPLLLLSD
ncbi:hypothetical protein RJT34_13854 [Clitoria ternatea]|uniref:Uncharacterized protein n=1 Tax=Clitoria ternatea TaxID=43366 RepID=A0AAN9PMM3_CLITE